VSGVDLQQLSCMGSSVYTNLKLTYLNTGVQIFNVSDKCLVN